MTREAFLQRRNAATWGAFDVATMFEMLHGLASFLESQHPGLRSISNVTNDPTDADAFFAGVAQMKVRELLSRRATVNNELL